MADNARGIHVSPGVYTREVELNYAAKSLGITTLGVVGETVKGPAFQPMLINNWRDFQNMFGGTNPEKFKGSRYPKYELPYIAKSYLSQSQQLEVCRVLGLSGYNAGPSWAVTIDLKTSVNGKNKMVIAIIRARGEYEKYFKYENDTTSTGTCECELQSYDTLVYKVGEKSIRNCYKPTDYNLSALQISKYFPLEDNGNECTGYDTSAGNGEFTISSTNYGRFKLYGWTGRHTINDMNSNSYAQTDGFKDKNGNFNSTSSSTFNTAVKKGDLLVESPWFNEAGATEQGKSQTDYFEYAVTLNPNDRDYILKVIGSSADEGEAPIYVESLYDGALLNEINNGNAISITKSLTPYQVYYTADHDGVKPVYDFMYLQESQLSRKNVGQRFVASLENVNQGYSCHLYDYKSGKPVYSDYTVLPSETDGSDTNTKWSPNSGITYATSNGTKKISYSAYIALSDTDKKLYTIVPQIVNVGQIYTVSQYTDSDGKRHYYYRYYSQDDNYIKYLANVKNNNIIPIIDKLEIPANMSDVQVSGASSAYTNEISSYKRTLVKNNADGLYYKMVDTTFKDSNNNSIYDVDVIKLDLNNYKTAYRYASTPWIVSNLKGDYKGYELNKLFRFHTISDGNSSNYQIKVSIANIRPDEGFFDVIVRNINDTDSNILPLEKYSKCSLVPGTSNYLGLKIGTYDGSYESKSNYITVEINENSITENSIPAGFLGYPRQDFNGTQIQDNAKYCIDGHVENNVSYDVTNPLLIYNCNIDEDIKHKRQYFGLSDLTGIDVDLFTYKGNSSYVNSPEYITQGFHLDARLDSTDTPIVKVDGETGYSFDSVSIDARTSSLTDMPIIGKEIEMEGSIYEYVDMRKFTVYFYGGFDGWDVFRKQRSNTDDFKKSKYRGLYNDISGEGYSFDKITDAEALGLNQDGITSDWYAYLSAIRQFSNPQSIDINVFATPGIDYINNQSLVEETIEMIEEERADSIYVVTTPDKPNGAEDYISEMYTSDDVVYNLEDTEIDSNYTCTYYPWIKYYDQDNSQYIMLPATKDVVRNMAQTDNTSFPWFAPAGFNRGDVDCVKAHYITKLSDEDVLYEGRINPIKTFSQEGCKIWGQKNLQKTEGLLNRIAVRRLILRLRKLMAIACNKLIFDPNDSSTKNKFLSLITPILDNVKSNRGISDYRIEVNDSVEDRERRELNAKLFIKPINALEWINLDLVITPESVSFDDI